MEQTTNSTSNPAKNHDLKLAILIPFAPSAKAFSTLIISHLIAWQTPAFLGTGAVCNRPGTRATRCQPSARYRTASGSDRIQALNYVLQVLFCLRNCRW